MNQNGQTTEQRIEQIRAKRKMLRELAREDLGLVFNDEDFLLSQIDRITESLEKANGLLYRIRNNGVIGNTQTEIESYLKQQKIIP